MKGPIKPVLLLPGLVLMVVLSAQVKARAAAVFSASSSYSSVFSNAAAGQGRGERSPIMPLLTFGYDRLLADYYWLSFIAYAGDSRARQKDHYRQADRYLDVITRLDPHFLQAYWFTAFWVGADEGRPDLARTIIDRGIAANPDDWTLPFIGGFNLYLFAGDESAAARYYRMAARFPAAPRWLGEQAALLERGIPRIYKQIGIWERIYHSQEQPLVRQKALETLTSLWLSVYRDAPDETTRSHAAAELRTLGLNP